MKVKCEVCPHGCVLSEKQVGFCKARANINGAITCINYGRIVSIALDPVEKKPLKRFFPGSRILSVGSFGCNLRCGFCQNHNISMSRDGECESVFISPEKLVEEAVMQKPHGNIGIAYTYNEPLVGIEYVLDCSTIAHDRGIKNVVVSNGYVCENQLLKLLPHIDAMNIDLKGFTKGFYKSVCGDLDTVMNTVKIAAEKCHVEITTLIIPNENDGEDEIKELSKWIAGIDSNIPLHLSRFFPTYKYSDREATRVEKIYRLADVAKSNLKHVYTGNCP